MMVIVKLPRFHYFFIVKQFVIITFGVLEKKKIQRPSTVICQLSIHLHVNPLPPFLLATVLEHKADFATPLLKHFNDASESAELCVNILTQSSRPLEVQPFEHRPIFHPHIY